MPKSSRAYRGAKRAKELVRQKKQEEKRLRRQTKHKRPEEEGGTPPGEETPEPSTPETQ